MNSIILAIQDGGIWMAPIIISFVFALAIAAERLVFILSAKSNKSALMEVVKSAIMSGSPNKAVQECSKLAEKKQALPAVLLAGLQAANRSEKEVESAMEQATLEQFPKLTKRMAFLPMLANVATLSGLLGTIIGLIEAFDAVANAAPDQKQIMLAKGISKAMYTTAGGLVVAIPTLIINSILTAMVTGIMDEVDQSSAELLNRIRANKRSEAAK
jgi:biopolymer transport protein ExbB/TolQ